MSRLFHKKHCNSAEKLSNKPYFKILQTERKEIRHDFQCFIFNSPPHKLHTPLHLKGKYGLEKVYLYQKFLTCFFVIGNSFEL